MPGGMRNECSSWNWLLLRKYINSLLADRVMKERVCREWRAWSELWCVWRWSAAWLLEVCLEMEGRVIPLFQRLFNVLE